MVLFGDWTYFGLTGDSRAKSPLLELVFFQIKYWIVDLASTILLISNVNSRLYGFINWQPYLIIFQGPEISFVILWKTISKVIAFRGIWNYLIWLSLMDQ